MASSRDVSQEYKGDCYFVTFSCVLCLTKASKLKKYERKSYDFYMIVLHVLTTRKLPHFYLIRQQKRFVPSLNLTLTLHRHKFHRIFFSPNFIMSLLIGFLLFFLLLLTFVQMHAWGKCHHLRLYCF